MKLLDNFRNVPRQLRETSALAWLGLREWDAKRFVIAGASAAGVLLLVGMVTVLIPNSVFARDIPPVWWNYPVWVLTSIFSGMLLATYLRVPGAALVENESKQEGKSGGRFGLAGSMLAWFAVGCPVCNKIALLALGYSGAITWFAPIQPWLAVAALVLTGGALLGRLRGQISCPVPVAPSRTAVGA